MSVLSESLLVPIERLMNRGIAESAAAAESAAGLEKRSMVIYAEPPALRMCLSVLDGRLRLHVNHDQVADVEIKGTPVELIRLFFVDEHAPIREGRIAVTGSADIAEQFRELCRLAGPDLEQQLTRVIGAPAAFQVANVSQSFMRWARTTGETTADHLSDILQEDSELLPTAEDIQQFNADVDEASNALARLEARLKLVRLGIDARESRDP